MSIQELAHMEQEFAKHLSVIRSFSHDLPKSHVLRVGAWLKKLCSVVDNYFWRKNRNLYTEVLATMLKQGNLLHPFDKFPPDGSLPKLTLYEIPFFIRQQLQTRKDKPEQNNKENISVFANTQKISDFQKRNYRDKKKCSWQQSSLNSLKIEASQCQIFPNQFEQMNKNMKTVRRQSEEKSEQRLVEIIEQSLLFLAKNNEKFEDNSEFIDLIKEIVEFGESIGKDFRSMKFSLISQ